MYVHSDQKEEAERAVDNAIFGLKKQTLVEVDKKVVVLKTRMEAKMNEIRQNTATNLQDIKEIVAAIWGG